MGKGVGSPQRIKAEGREKAEAQVMERELDWVALGPDCIPPRELGCLQCPHVTALITPACSSGPTPMWPWVPETTGPASFAQAVRLCSLCLGLDTPSSDSFYVVPSQLPPSLLSPPQAPQLICLTLALSCPCPTLSKGEHLLKCAYWIWGWDEHPRGSQGLGFWPSSAPFLASGDPR